jgi:hypothetical protein
MRRVGSMEPEGMRNGWTQKVTMKTATTMMVISDWTAGRMPGL